MAEKILEIKDLRVNYQTDLETVEAVNGIDLEIEKSGTLGLVGETGAGKTTTALSIMRLLPATTGRILGGEILFEGENLLETEEEKMRKIRHGFPGSYDFAEPCADCRRADRRGHKASQ